jgi:hypothetical protein
LRLKLIREAKMKIVVIILLLLLPVGIIFGQYYQLPEKSYFATLYFSTTGSGHGLMTNYSLGVETERKSLELGAVVDTKLMALTGSEIMYKKFNKPRRTKATDLSLKNTPFRLYFLYNFVIHRTDQIKDLDATQNYLSLANGHSNKVTTMEHYVGFGFQAMLSQNIQLDSNLGAGVYLGTIYAKGMHPSSLGIHGENYGFVMSANIGVSYIF